MHADLVKLLDLQTKDTTLAEAERHVAAIRQEVAALDAAVHEARTSAATARKTLGESMQRRDELEKKVEASRAAQQRRQQRVDQVRTQKEATAAMTELEIGGTALAKEEAEWMRSAELVEQQEQRARELETSVAEAEAAQQPERERLAAELQQADEARAAAAREREASAAQVDRPLRTRYDRLRGSRLTEVVVPLTGSTCGACFTVVPLNRRTLIRNGQAIDGCEACGAILYPANE